MFMVVMCILRISNKFSDFIYLNMEYKAVSKMQDSPKIEQNNL